MPRRAPSPVHRPEYTAFRRHLREWREAAGLTQRALAKRMGRPLTWVHKCETGGRRMDPLEFFAWCDACGIEVGKAAKTLGR